MFLIASIKLSDENLLAMMRPLCKLAGCRREEASEHRQWLLGLLSCYAALSFYALAPLMQISSMIAS